jgi:hypothetical protein
VRPLPVGPKRHTASVADFKLVVEGGVYLNRWQTEAIEELGAETGGTLKVEQHGDGAVLVVAPGGRRFVYFWDGRIEGLT